MKKPLSTLLICLLVAGFAGQLIGSANANFMPIPIPQPAIVIQADGSVSPAGAPIERNGNVYTFARDIVGYTVASERDNVVIDGNGFTLRGSGNSTGVFLKNRNGVTVQNLTVTGFAYGIHLFAESYFGMNSTGNKLLNNTVTGNQYGIYISSSSSNTLQGNCMSNNTYNFWVASTYVNDIDTSNTVEGKPIIYWVGVQKRAAPANAGYVAFVNCANVTAQGLSLTSNGQGIVVVSTSGATVAQNTVTKCDSSIYLNNATANTITNNNLTGNANGVRGETCSGNLIQANTAASNKIGIYFTGTCANNTITKNAITANFEDGVNLWGSMGTVLSENTITGNVETGINLFDSRGNNITANTIADNPGIGAKLWYDADANSFRGNTFANNSIGILINDSFDNTVVGNSFVGNRDWGMRFEDQQNNNVILQNNFVGNRPGGDGLQVSITGSGILTPKPGGGNIWDNGAAGNYWSDYQRRYPNATLKGTSGTGDTPYYINENNADHHPMIALLNISSVEVTPSPTTTPTPSPSPTTSATATPTPASTLTPSPTPAPSVPELPWWVTAVLFFAALALVAVFGKGARH